jgi:hypothetical protein
MIAEGGCSRCSGRILGERAKKNATGSSSRGKQCGQSKY